MDKHLTPLGSLLERVREARRPKMSQNAVAKAAGTSSTTYRRVISGKARFGGQDVVFPGAPQTIALIADVLDVTPEQLEGTGRADAAAELRALHKSASDHDRRANAPAADAADVLAGLPDDPEERRRALTDLLREAVKENARNAARQSRIAEELERLDRETG